MHICIHRITPAIDPEVLEKMRMSHFVGHAPKPAHIRYNQVLYDLDRDMGDHVPESPMMRGEWTGRGHVLESHMKRGEGMGEHGWLCARVTYVE